MRFVKVEGAGNDYVLVEGPLADPADWSRRLSDRHTGVGSDGLLLVRAPREGAPAAMRIFNADGSEGRMCGNGLRCVVRWLVERHGADPSLVPVQTASGPRHGRMDSSGAVQVAMGVPSFVPREVPVRADGDGRAPWGLPVPDDLPGDPPLAYAVGTGNPHLVLRVGAVATVDLEHVGRTLQADERLPEGANVHVVQCLAPTRLAARPYERGSGATRACGTGAVAVAAVARSLGWTTGDEVVVSMPGGDLPVSWAGPGHEAWLGGPARLVFDGEWHDS